MEEQPLQQQQQERSWSIEEEDLFAPDQLDDETMHVMQILTGIAEMNAQREVIGNVIENTGGCLGMRFDRTVFISSQARLGPSLLLPPDSMHVSVIQSRYLLSTYG